MSENIPIYEGTLDSVLSREFYGMGRGNAKLLVVDNSIMHSNINNLELLLNSNDLLIFNNSKTVKSSLEFYNSRIDRYGRINIGTDRNRGAFIFEPRPRELNTLIHIGDELELFPSGEKVIVKGRDSRFPRYWWGYSKLNIDSILEKDGQFIRYDHIPFEIPSDSYESYFSKIPGSVEFPSASYHFVPSVIENIRRKGVKISEITLHCNLGSLERSELNEKTMKEFYSVDSEVVREIYLTKKSGGRVIAVGTTVVKALETLYSLYGNKIYEMVSNIESSKSHKFQGITEIYIKRDYNIKAVDALITGMHEYDSSHLDMLLAFVDYEILNRAFDEVGEFGYEWHEFGDLMFISRS